MRCQYEQTLFVLLLQRSLLLPDLPHYLLGLITDFVITSEKRNTSLHSKAQACILIMEGQSNKDTDRTQRTVQNH